MIGKKGMWDMEECVFGPGEEVLYNGAVWKILTVCRSDDGEQLLEIIGIDVDGGNSGEFDIHRKMVPACVCGKQVYEMTAAEYAEKLAEVFPEGAATAERGEHRHACVGMRCTSCPLKDERRMKTGFNGSCEALVWYRPDLTVKLLEEWAAEKEAQKPKGKTYREDFFEKFPNADRTAAGLPMPCRNKLYFAAAPCSSNQRKNCDDCWNEVMPEEDDEE